MLGREDFEIPRTIKIILVSFGLKRLLKGFVPIFFF